MNVSTNIRTTARKALLITAAIILVLPLALEAAKPIPVTVTAANPSEAIQGQELDVLVSGTGFGAGSTVSYLVTGTTDASQVVVTSVTYLPATGQLKTHIKVNGAAVVTNYDIQVTTSTGRKGKGTTLFKVSLDPSVILPVSLGVPTGCDTGVASRLNDGAYLAGLIVVGDTWWCTSGKEHPYLWKDGTWYDLGTLGSATSGVTEGVSNDGKVVGRIGSSSWGTAFVASGGILSTLPSLPGMSDAHASGISQDGTHIVGTNSLVSPIIDDEATVPVRWLRDAGGSWSVEPIGAYGPGLHRTALASSDDGSVIVGYGHQEDNSAVLEGWVWVEGGSPEWVSLGAGTNATDIDPTATMIVGFRNLCSPSCSFTIALYWTLDGAGNWVSHELPPLDSNFSSYAFGVGMVSGKLVVVGRSDVRKDASSISRAVAWLPQPSGGYGPPILLAAINGSSSLGAQARDVNANGVVAGSSSVPPAQGSNLLRAVLWMLPPMP